MCLHLYTNVSKWLGDFAGLYICQLPTGHTQTFHALSNVVDGFSVPGAFVKS